MRRCRLTPIPKPARLDDMWCVSCAVAGEGWLEADYNLEVRTTDGGWIAVASVCTPHAEHYAKQGAIQPAD